MNCYKILFLFLVAAALSGCQFFSFTRTAAQSDFQRAQTLSSLHDFGDQGGELVVGVYDTAVIVDRLRIATAQSVDRASNDETVVASIGDFVRRSGLSGARANPLIEIGALYYFPNRFNSENDRTGSVIQKACATVDGHNVDAAVIVDEPSGVISDRRKLFLSGSADADLIQALSGISASADATYLFEIEILNSRLRSIDPNDGVLVRDRILAGDRCRTDFIPQVGGLPIYQLTSAYYGEMRVKQAYEVSGSVALPRLELELTLQAENERETFLFFKVFLDELELN